MSANLILTNPTDDERRRTWQATHPQWGAALTLDGYLERESRQLDIPLARHGGLTNWILTEPPAGPDTPRPILSSCETLRKRALVADPDGLVREVTAHGVASVFTDPRLRGRGYARTMMARLSRTLSESNAQSPDGALFSILYSDIGKQFYALNGWEPYTSTHVAFPPDPSSPPHPHLSSSSDSALCLLQKDNLPDLVHADEQRLRRDLARPSQAGATRVAILPSLDQIQWHLAREDLVCHLLHHRHPDNHGAMYTTQTGARVWAIWTRSYSGTVQEPAKNTLYILRLVVEDNVRDQDLPVALEAIVGAARRQASEWACGSVQAWNPDDRLRTAAEHLGGHFVVRETDSICALNWFGDAETGGKLEWVLNEKYAWC